jgi:hypothetical protein
LSAENGLVMIPRTCTYVSSLEANKNLTTLESKPDRHAGTVSKADRPSKEGWVSITLLSAHRIH